MGKGGYYGGSTIVHGGSGWFGNGSVTSQSGSVTSQSGKKKKSAGAKKSKRPSKKTHRINKDNGLTRAEKFSKASNKVVSIEKDIAKTKQRLQSLERILKIANNELEEAKNLPFKTYSSGVDSKK